MSRAGTLPLPGRLRPAVILLVAGLAKADQAQAIDRAAAAKLAAMGDGALKDGQEATARRIFRRAIELDPDQPVARARLGYRRAGKGWKAPASPSAGEDANPAAGARLMQQLRIEEERRASAYLRAQLKDHYPKLLERLPRHEELHKALGHERIGDRYARPDLAAAAKRFDEQQARWRGIAAPAAIEPAGTATIPGIGARPAYRVDGALVSGTLPDGEIREIARRLPAARALLRELFGSDVRVWERPLALFLPREDYRRCVEAALPAGEERERRLRYNTAYTPDLAAFATKNAVYGSDVHAHTLGAYSAEGWCAPRAGDERDWRAYAWFREGVGYLASLATSKTGMTWFTAQESTTKIPPTVPPPEPRERAELLAWLQGQILDGTTEPLRDVFGRSMNNLDLLASLQAWSFLEFLAAYDPDGLRRLPAALRAEEEGPYPERSARALEACFGKGLADLEPLWRAFVLEIM